MPGGVTPYGMSCIRSWEYTVGPIEPDPDDERRFMDDTARAALDRMVQIAHEADMYEKCSEPVRTR